jgi:hypothetical protein
VASAEEKNGEVSLFCLQGYILDLFVFVFPGLILYWRRNRVTGACFNNIALLNFFTLLYSGGRYNPDSVLSLGLASLISTLSPITINF